MRRPFVPGAAYTAGRGAALAALLHAWREAGLCMRNVKRENLVVARDGSVHIVDIGRDVVPYSDGEFQSMAMRVYLCGTLRGYTKEQLAEACRAPRRCEQAWWGDFSRVVCGDMDKGDAHRFDTAAALAAALPCLAGAARLEAPVPHRLDDVTSTTRSIERSGWVVTQQGFSEALVVNDRLEAAPARYGWDVAPAGERAAVTVVIKCCAQDAAVLEAQMRHLAEALGVLGGWAEVVLLAEMLPPPGGEYLRAFVEGEYEELRKELEQTLQGIETAGLVDRVVRVTTGEAAAFRKTNARWFGLDSEATHAAAGQSYASFLAFVDRAPEDGGVGKDVDVVLQLDSDVIINTTTAPRFDLCEHATRAFKEHPAAVTLAALPIYDNASPRQADGVPGVRFDSDYSSWGSGRAGPFRFEVRFGFLHLQRLRQLLPLDGGGGDVLPRPWYRLLDDRLALNPRPVSLRMTVTPPAAAPFFIHPPNELKASRDEYLYVAERAAHRTPTDGGPWAAQAGRVDLTGPPAEWLAERREDLVVVVVGRNVEYPRARLCLDSLHRDITASTTSCFARAGVSVGVVVADDASDCRTAVAELRKFAAGRFDNLTFVAHATRQGYLRNTAHCITRVCANDETVVVTLDMDDCLVQHDEGVLAAAWAAAFQDRRYDVAVGGTFRPDKPRLPIDEGRYKVDPAFPRFSPGAAGNVWAHLRCFRKRLFDGIPAGALNDADEPFRTAGGDWAIMIPVVEAAGPDRVKALGAPLYHFDPSTGTPRAVKHAALDAVRAALQRAPMQPMATVHIPSIWLLGAQLVVTVYPYGLVVHVPRVHGVHDDDATVPRTAVTVRLDAAARAAGELRRRLESISARGEGEGEALLLVGCDADAPPAPCSCCDSYERFLVRHGAGCTDEVEVEAACATDEADGLTYLRHRLSASGSGGVEAVECECVTNAAFATRAEGAVVHVRLHSECFTGDALGSLKCDCGEQLQRFLASAREEREPHLLVYLVGHEGRGHGLAAKMRAYAAAERDPGLHHEAALEGLGRESDVRSYAAAVEEVLKGLYALERVVLHTNNPDKRAAVEGAGIGVEPSAAVSQVPNRHNRAYLTEKRDSERLRQRGVLLHSDEDVDELLRQVGVAREGHPSVAGLKAALRRVLCAVPFHTLRVGKCGAEVLLGGGVAGLLSGGLCTTLNTLLLVLLRRLRYDAFWAAGTTAHGTTLDHALLLVRVPGHGVHWVDVGNARPYYDPLPIPLPGRTAASETPTHRFAAYRVSRNALGTCVVEHRPEAAALWHVNYSFDPVAVYLHDVERIHSRHHTAGDAPFRGALRCSMWDAEGKAFAVKGGGIDIYPAPGEAPVPGGRQDLCDLMRDPPAADVVEELVAELAKGAPPPPSSRW
eukprot:TRINITY_DN3065_c0_g1_i7.p1 TRINITY_DN3065_c0_g1~~TRINITY_DN3065_c0_g1_i7.p1  ORF type:complete len:1382 (+),score=364.05 TRINITY_DN3065_c0_g1_i7:1411-5556(+)